MPEQFDPARHRVWAVDVSFAYRTYVVAGDAAEAERIAEENEADDREAACSSFDASELTQPLPDADGVVPPWGAMGWGRRELSVNQALDLITNPRPAPEMPPTYELRPLATWDWVRLAAASRDDRPVLQAVHTAARSVASDGHRLHAAEACGEAGLWDAETRERFASEQPYPDVDSLLGEAAPTLELVDLPGAWQVLRAAGAAVAFPHGDGSVLLDAVYVREALLGGAAAARTLLTVRGPRSPVRLDFPDLGRTALVMPLLGGCASTCDLAPYVRALAGEAER